MSEYGVIEDGSFERKPIDVLREEIRQDFINELGEDIELRPSSPLTQIINASAVEFSKQWACIESVYFAGFFEDAFGVQLDKKLALAGFQREALRGATGVITLQVSDPAQRDITVPEETIVQAPDTKQRPRIPFKTTETAVINEGETNVTDVSIAALEPFETDVDGEFLGEATNLAANTITEFENPQPDIDSVTNPVATGTGRTSFTEGRDRETDAEFKNRYIASFSRPGDATLDAIKPQVFNADPGIVGVDVTEVYNESGDEYGVRVTVVAPNVDNDVIAQAIFESRAAGIESFGDKSGTAIDDDGQPHVENFQTATDRDLEIEIDLITGSAFPENGQTEIEDRIIRYVGGTNNDGVTFPGLGIEEDVIFDQVFRRVINQQGVIQADVAIGPLGGTLDTDNVPINSLEAATVAPSDITFL
jgi:uncharacterized phage protein gp47/JayE